MFRVCKRGKGARGFKNEISSDVNRCRLSLTVRCSPSLRCVSTWKPAKLFKGHPGTVVSKGFDGSCHVLLKTKNPDNTLKSVWVVFWSVTLSNFFDLTPEMVGMMEYSLQPNKVKMVLEGL